MYNNVIFRSTIDDLFNSTNKSNHDYIQMNFPSVLDIKRYIPSVFCNHSDVSKRCVISFFDSKTIYPKLAKIILDN